HSASFASGTGGELRALDPSMRFYRNRLRGQRRGAIGTSPAESSQFQESDRQKKTEGRSNEGRERLKENSIKRTHPGNSGQLDQQNCDDRTEPRAVRGVQNHPGHTAGQKEH